MHYLTFEIAVGITHYRQPVHDCDSLYKGKTVAIEIVFALRGAVDAVRAGYANFWSVAGIDEGTSFLKRMV